MLGQIVGGSLKAGSKSYYYNRSRPLTDVPVKRLLGAKAKCEAGGKSALAEG